MKEIDGNGKLTFDPSFVLASLGDSLGDSLSSLFRDMDNLRVKDEDSLPDSLPLDSLPTKN